MIPRSPIQSGNTCTVQSGPWRVTIEHLDVTNGSLADLFETIRCTCLGVGFSANVIDEYLETQTEIEE